MDYTIEGETHILSLDKDELVTLISLVHEGMENINEKSRVGNQLAGLKSESARIFVTQLNKKIMSA